MRFNAEIALLGKPIVSWIEKDEKSSRIDVVLDRYGNRSVLSFDTICFCSFLNDLNEYAEKGKVSHRPYESCQGQTDLDVFFLDLSRDKRFLVRFDLGNVRGNCGLILRSNYTQVSLYFSEDQISKIMDKFKNAITAKEALREVEKEIIVKPGGPNKSSPHIKKGDRLLFY